MYEYLKNTSIKNIDTYKRISDQIYSQSIYSSSQQLQIYKQTTNQSNDKRIRSSEYNWNSSWVTKLNNSN